jgi:hypothetical protein
VKTVFDTFCGSLRISQDSHSNTATTILDVRRVDTENDGEHVQIAVEVQTHYARRTNTASGYICLKPEEVPYLITALTKLHPKYDPSNAHRPWSTRATEEREFYGLPKQKGA